MRRLLLAIALVASVFAGCVGEPPSGVRDEYDPSVPHCVGECGRVVDGSPAAPQRA